MLIGSSTLMDIDAIVALYRRVAAIKGGLARIDSEITRGYVENFVRQSLGTGFSLVARMDSVSPIVGEIHTYALGPQVFAHVLGELTIAVDPDHQGQGIGKALFTHLLDIIKKERPDILRVELIARESNRKALAFYQTLGFQIEGKMEGRIRSVDGSFEADIPMAWHRPS